MWLCIFGLTHFFSVSLFVLFYLFLVLFCQDVTAVVVVGFCFTAATGRAADLLAAMHDGFILLEAGRMAA